MLIVPLQALFAGESDAGKTMATEVIANDLKLGLFQYQIPLGIHDEHTIIYRSIMFKTSILYNTYKNKYAFYQLSTGALSSR